MNYNRELHDEIIKKSHKRSEEYGVEKDRIYSKKILVGKEIFSQIRANKSLIRVASPFMKIFYDFLLDTGFIIVLTDKDGCILNLIGDKQTINAGRDLYMVIGAYMDEKSIGTNAMGTAIKENSPVQISAKEHFVTIPLLINYFLNIKAEKLKKSVPIIKNDVYNHMLKYDWPGNIRELENYIENIVNFNGDIPSIMDKRSEISMGKNDNVLTTNSMDEAYILSLEEMEKRAIRACMLKCSGNMTRVSKILGISRNTLYCKIKKYNIET